MKKFFKLSGGSEKKNEGGDGRFGSPRSSVSSGWSSVGAGVGTVAGYQVDLRDKAFTKLHKACWTGSLEKVKKHIKKIDVNQVDSQKRTPLHLATANGYKDVVWFLLGSKAQPNVPDRDGNTPLLTAIICHRDELVQFLLDRGADCRATDLNGLNGLHHVAQDGRQDVAVALIQKGTNLNAQNKDEFCPLMVAAQHGQLEMAELFLRHGASVGILDKRRRNCLMISCDAGDAGLARLFLDHGVSVTATDADGLDAEQVSREANSQACLQLIRDFAARDDSLDSAAGSRRRESGSDHLPESEKVVLHPPDDLLDGISRTSAVDMDADFEEGDPLSWNDEPSEEIVSLPKTRPAQPIDLSKFLPESDQSLSEATPKLNATAKRSPPASAPDITHSSNAEAVRPTNPGPGGQDLTVKDDDDYFDRNETYNSDISVGFGSGPVHHVAREEAAISVPTGNDQQQRDLMAELGLSDFSVGSTDSDLSRAASPMGANGLRSSDKSFKFTYVPSAPSIGTTTQADSMSVTSPRRFEAQSLDTITTTDSPMKPPRMFKKNVSASAACGRTASSAASSDERQKRESPLRRNSASGESRPLQENYLTRGQSLGSLQTVYVSVQRDDKFGSGSDESDWGEDEEPSSDNAGTIHLRPVVLRRMSPEIQSSPRASTDVDGAAIVGNLEEATDSMGCLPKVTHCDFNNAIGSINDETVQKDSLDQENVDEIVTSNGADRMNFVKATSAGDDEDDWDDEPSGASAGPLPPTQPSAPPSKSEGTLGRDGTLHGVDELWETNALLELPSPSSPVVTPTSLEEVSRDERRDTARSLGSASDLYYADLVLLSSGSDSASRNTLGRGAEAEKKPEEIIITTVAALEKDADQGTEVEVNRDDVWDRLWQHIGLQRPHPGDHDSVDGSVSSHQLTDEEDRCSPLEGATPPEGSSTDHSQSSLSIQQQEECNRLLSEAVRDPASIPRILELIRQLRVSWQREASRRKALGQRVQQQNECRVTGEARQRDTSIKLVEAEGEVARLASQLATHDHNLSSEAARRELIELQLVKSQTQLSGIEEIYMIEVNEHQRSDLEARACRAEVDALKKMLAEMRDKVATMHDAEAQTSDVAGGCLMLDTDTETTEVAHLEEEHDIEKQRYLAQLTEMTSQLVDEKARHQETGQELGVVQQQMTAFSFKLLEAERRLAEVQSQLSCALSDVDSKENWRLEEERLRAEAAAKLITSEERNRSLSDELMAARCALDETKLEASLTLTESQSRQSSIGRLELEAGSREAEIVRLQQSLADARNEMALATSTHLRTKLQLENSEKLMALRLQSENNMKTSWEDVATSLRANYESAEKQLRELSETQNAKCDRLQQELTASVDCCARLDRELRDSASVNDNLVAKLDKMQECNDRLVKSSTEAEQNCAIEKDRCCLLIETIDRKSAEIALLTEQTEQLASTSLELKELRDELASTKYDADVARADVLAELMRAVDVQDSFCETIREKDVELREANARLEKLNESVVMLQDKLRGGQQQAKQVMPQLQGDLKEALDRLRKSESEVDRLQQLLDSARTVADQQLHSDVTRKSMAEPAINGAQHHNRFYLATVEQPQNGGPSPVTYPGIQERVSHWPTNNQDQHRPMSENDRIAKMEANVAQLQASIEQLRQTERSYVEPPRPVAFDNGSPYGGGGLYANVSSFGIGAGNLNTPNSSVEGLHQRVNSLQRELSDERQQRAAKEAQIGSFEQQLLEARNLLKHARDLQAGEEVNWSRAQLHRGCVDRSEVELMRQQWEIRSRLEFNETINQMKSFLEEQARTSDRLEQMHSLSESKLRREYQQAVTDLQREVGRLQENLDARDTRQGALEDQYQHLTRLVEARRRVKGKLFEQQQKQQKVGRGHVTLFPQPGAAGSQRPVKRDLFATSTPDSIGGATYPITSSSSYSFVPPNNSNNARTAVLNGKYDDPLGYKLRLELDRSVSNHYVTAENACDLSSVARRYGATNLDVPYEKAAASYLKTLKRNYLL